ncbi:MAG: phosphotransferase [bacterium]|nr:phosphotransferase [bacterium]MDE0416613.1 phosphotransferase [bacterium]
MSLLEIVCSDGRPARIVLRRCGRANLLANPDTADTEFRLLTHLAALGYPVPRTLVHDPSCAAPWLLLDYSDGEPLWHPPEEHALAMAGFLVDLHGIAPGEALSFVPCQTMPDTPASTLLDLPADLDWPPGAPGARRLLHGDFWTGNVLWRNGGLAAVIDWEDAVIGDPLTDLAIARSNLVWTHGIRACRTFTAHYRDAMGLDPYRLRLWDIHAAVTMAPHAGDYAADWQDLGRMDLSEAVILERLQELVDGAVMP